MAGSFFSGRAFAGWKKCQEGEHKVQTAVIGRLNDVIRSIGFLAKVLAKRR